MKKLSIIVPVYNVEKYIRNCVESIFRQGLSDDEFEVIIVNDGTPDNSMDQIADIVKTHTNILVINQTCQGPSIARNSGLKHAVGEYIAFIDSDDILIDNSLSILLGKAINSNADLIMANYIEMNTEVIPSFPTVNYENIIVKEKTGDSIFLEDFDPNDCHVWHTLYRRVFLETNNISFIPKIYYEDIPFTHECYLKARKSLKISLPMYIYRQSNTKSITSNFCKKSCIDLCTVLNLLWELTKDTNYSPEITTKIRQNCYATFSALTYCIVHDIHNQRDRLYMLKNIKRTAPNMNFKNGLRQKSVNFMYRRLPWAYLYLRIFYAHHLESTTKKIVKQFKKAKRLRFIRH